MQEFTGLETHCDLQRYKMQYIRIIHVRFLVILGVVQNAVASNMWIMFYLLYHNQFGYSISLVTKRNIEHFC